MKDQSKHVRVMEEDNELMSVTQIEGDWTEIEPQLGVFGYKYTDSWLLKTRVIKKCFILFQSVF